MAAVIADWVVIGFFVPFKLTIIGIDNVFIKAYYYFASAIISINFVLRNIGLHIIKLINRRSGYEYRFSRHR